MKNQTTPSPSSRKHFLQLQKLSSFLKEAGKKGIFVALFSIITEIGHILCLKEMDHQHTAPPPQLILVSLPPPPYTVLEAFQYPCQIPSQIL